MKLRVRDVPKDFPVKPFLLHRLRNPAPKGTATCGACGLSWDDDRPTQWTPTPSGRCPFEFFCHRDEA